MSCLPVCSFSCVICVFSFGVFATEEALITARQSAYLPVSCASARISTKFNIAYVISPAFVDMVNIYIKLDRNVRHSIRAYTFQSGIFQSLNLSVEKLKNSTIQGYNFAYGSVWV
jgi:hypothetical protein